MDKKEYLKNFTEIELYLRDYNNKLKLEHFDLKKGELKEMINEIRINEIENQIKFISNLIKELNK